MKLLINIVMILFIQTQFVFAQSEAIENRSLEPQNDTSAVSNKDQHAMDEHVNDENKKDAHEESGQEEDGHEEGGHEEGGQEEDDHEEDGHEEGGHEEGGHEEGGHEEGGHEEGEPGIVELSSQSLLAAGIQISELRLEQLADNISGFGEVQLNQYSSAEVTPLVDSVVIQRHARLGDEVEARQSLVTLASVEVAQAQGQLRIASNEWQRARKLGKSAIGAKRYTEAEVAYEQARLTLSAYGLDIEQIDSISTRKIKGTLGRFDLTAPLAGTILSDDFRIGQRIEAGQKLFLISDESQIWVEANLSPKQADKIQAGVSVVVNIDGHLHNGKVIQKHHLLDEQTRTVPIRIAVETGGEHHHPGEFVQVSIDLIVQDGNSAGSAMSLTVPESALMQDDEQNWTIFVEQNTGRFKQTIIQRGVTRGSKVGISGLPEGTPVVITGAFFLASELAKSGFDIHDH